MSVYYTHSLKLLASANITRDVFKFGDLFWAQSASSKRCRPKVTPQPHLLDYLFITTKRTDKGTLHYMCNYSQRLSVMVSARTLSLSFIGIWILKEWSCILDSSVLGKDPSRPSAQSQIHNGFISLVWTNLTGLHRAQASTQSTWTGLPAWTLTTQCCCTVSCCTMSA